MLFHDVLGSRVVDPEQGGSLLDGRTLDLYDVDEVLTLLGLHLHVAALRGGAAARVP